MMTTPLVALKESMQRGFSLLELSIVLVIISLLAGGGLTMATSALKAADRVTTQERLTTIKIALDSYAKTYGYLPCPFDRALATNTALFGIENRVAGTAGCGATNGTSFINAFPVLVGGVPVRTLGLPDSYAGDAWGNKFTYTTGDFLVNDASSYSRRVGQLVVKYGNIATGYSVNTQRLATAPTYSAVTDLGGGVARITVNDTSNLAAGSIVHLSSNTPATGYKGSYTVVVPPVVGAEAIVANTSFTVSGLAFTATDAGKVEWLAAGDDVAYTVVSHGPDGRGAFPLNGTAVPTFKQCNNSAVANSSPPPCTDNTAPNLVCVDIENCDNDSTFYDTAYNDGNIAAQYFDDYIVWGSNALMRPPVNNSLYTSCAGNPCEPWCATCDLNYPGGGAVAPPATLTAPVALCKKVGTSNATDCKAACFWAGTTATGYQKCP